MSNDQLRTSTVVLEPGPRSPVPLCPWNDSRIDPSIIVDPPQSSVGDLPPGAQVARNEFPGLLMQPIQWPNLKLQSIPTTWPLFKLQPIHALSPMGKSLLVQAGQQAQSTAK